MGARPAGQEAAAVSITHVMSMECLLWLFLCRAPRIEKCKTSEPCGPQGFPDSYCPRARVDTEAKQTETTVTAAWKMGVRKKGFLEKVSLKPSGVKSNRSQGKRK